MQLSSRFLFLTSVEKCWRLLSSRSIRDGMSTLLTKSTALSSPKFIVIFFKALIACWNTPDGIKRRSSEVDNDDDANRSLSEVADVGGFMPQMSAIVDNMFKCIC